MDRIGLLPSTERISRLGLCWLCTERSKYLIFVLWQCCAMLCHSLDISSLSLRCSRQPVGAALPARLETGGCGRFGWLAAPVTTRSGREGGRGERQQVAARLDWLSEHRGLHCSYTNNTQRFGGETGSLTARWDRAELLLWLVQCRTLY